MKEKYEVISTKRMPAHLGRPLMLGAIVWLYLDRYKAPMWLIGALGMLFVILFLIVFYVCVRQKEREIVFEPETEQEKQRFSSNWFRNKMSS